MHAQKNLNGTAALNQQDIHTQSPFTNEEIITTKPVTTQLSNLSNHSPNNHNTI